MSPSVRKASTRSQGLLKAPKRPASGLKGGAPIKKPRLGWHKTKHYWFVVYKGQQFSCSTRDEATADVFLANFVLGVKDPGNARLGPFLEKALADLGPAWIYKRLLAFWRTKRIRDINEASCKAYLDFSLRERGLGKVADHATFADSTGRRELKMLFARARAAWDSLEGRKKPKAKGNRSPKDKRVRGWMPREGAPRTRFLFADEIQRFFLVALGRKVDPNAHDGWLRDPKTGRFVFEDRATRDRWEPVARLIMLGAYTGTRLASMLAARWTIEEGYGFVDLDAYLFYRTDAEEPGALKAAPVVRLHVKLHRFLRACRRRDLARGANCVIQGLRGEKLDVVRLWNEVREAALLDKEVIRHILRHSCATLLLADGVSLTEVAAFLGVDVENLLHHYAQVHPRLTDWPADVLDDAATGVPVEVSLETARSARQRVGF